MNDWNIHEAYPGCFEAVPKELSFLSDELKLRELDILIGQALPKFTDWEIIVFIDRVMVYPVIGRAESDNWTVIAYLDKVVAASHYDIPWDQGITPDLKAELDRHLMRINLKNLPVEINISMYR